MQQQITDTPHMCPLKFKVHRSIDAGSVAHDGMVWKEGLVLGQTILPSLGGKGQVLALKGIHKRTPPKRLPFGAKRSHKNRDYGKSPRSRRWRGIIKRSLPESLLPTSEGRYTEVSSPTPLHRRLRVWMPTNIRGYSTVERNINNTNSKLSFLHSFLRGATE